MEILLIPPGRNNLNYHFAVEYGELRQLLVFINFIISYFH